MKNTVKVYKNGFTLAEILVSLMILGVIATLTIPALVKNYNERAIVSSVLKACSTLSNAYNRAVADNGSPMEWIANGNDYTLFLKYLNTSKICTQGNDTSCFATNLMKNLTGWEDYATWAFGQRPAALLADGSSIVFWHHDPTNCQAGTKHDMCAVIFYDINGPQNGPNQQGKDIFSFELTQNSVRTEVTTSEDEECSLSDDYYSHPRNGSGCANYIVQHGNMNYLHEK